MRKRKNTIKIYQKMNNHFTGKPNDYQAYGKFLSHHKNANYNNNEIPFYDFLVCQYSNFDKIFKI